MLTLSTRGASGRGAEARRIWSILKLVLPAFLLLVGAAQPLYLGILASTSARSAWRERLLDAHSGRLEGYPDYLEQLAKHTQRGDRVALVVPFDQWNGGYMYAYYRAVYALPGCEVLPIIDASNQPLPQAFRVATHVAGWRVAPPQEQTRFVWQGAEGFLLELTIGQTEEAGTAR